MFRCTTFIQRLAKRNTRNNPKYEPSGNGQRLHNNCIRCTASRTRNPCSAAATASVRMVCEIGFNAGHGAVGWTLCCATADMVAEDVMCGGGSAACAPYAPDRFNLI